MKIDIRLESGAVMPTKATGGSCGYDLYATYKKETLYYTEYDTSVAVAIPEGYVGLVFPRSSISKLSNASLANSVGVIDQDYRGTIKCRFRGEADFHWNERIAQLLIVPVVNDVDWQTVDDLDTTERGEGGFGSTS